MDLSGARTAGDNRRANLTLFNEGTAQWRVGQGTVAGAAYTSEELSNFIIEKYAATGDTLSNYAPLIVERETSYMCYGLGTNAPQAHHHFWRVFGISTDISDDGGGVSGLISYLALRHK